MSHVFDHVLDALDVETFLVCESEEEGKVLGLKMMKDMGFTDVDVVFVDFRGVGARVRARAYIHRAGDAYPWLDIGKHKEEHE